MNLKAMRERAGLTQEQTAKKCDVSLTLIRRIEQTNYEPGSRIKRKLCRGLKCKMEELLYGRNSHGTPWNRRTHKGLQAESS